MSGAKKDKLKLLLERCKCGVYITVNEHRDIYQSAVDKLAELREHEPDGDLEIEKDIEVKMVELNTIINIHFYPDTPIGFYSIYHYDIDMALCQALEILGIAPQDTMEGVALHHATAQACQPETNQASTH